MAKHFLQIRSSRVWWTFGACVTYRKLIRLLVGVPCAPKFCAIFKSARAVHLDDVALLYLACPTPGHMRGQKPCAANPSTHEHVRVPRTRTKNMFSSSLDPRAHARHPRTGSPLPSLSVFLPMAWEETLKHAQKRLDRSSHVRSLSAGGRAKQ